jgi:cysteine-rich repeat protein
MRGLNRWIGVALVSTGAVVLGPFTGCGGSSNSTAPGDDGGTDGAGDDATTPDASKPVCGNGVVESGEDCDDGSKNGSPGDPCQRDCSWTCTAGTVNGDPKCNTGDPCQGHATCLANHTCQAGTPLGDGTSCGTGKICRSHVCSPAVCGDGVVTAPEECDDGSKNGTAGDGCDPNCKWVCVSTDPTRDCAPADPCAGQGTCSDTTHVCTAGTPEKDGTPCGGADAGADAAAAGSICKSGKCASAQCGDGIVEPGEQCDFGSGNGVGTGCEANCTFSCTLSPNSCVTQDLCAGTNTCTAFTQGTSPGQKCEVGTPPPDGTTCPNSGTCKNHVCVTALCGNGHLDAGEQCDWGTANNVAGSGCNPDCTFSCTTSPNSCPSPDPCAAQPQACQSVPPPTGATGNGQKCVAVTGLTACALCAGASNPNTMCIGNVCKAHVCGDSTCLGPGETCDPPNGTTCGPNCKSIVCGDGVLDGNEQCDDGNTTNLDGCDQYCNFELEQRATALKILGSTDSYCTQNYLGNQALTSLGLGQIQPSLDTDVGNGTINILFKFMGNGATPADLTGTSGAVTLGNLAGTTDNPDAGGYSGTNDLDWWYTVDPTSIDANRNPLSTLPGTYTNKTLNAGPGRLTLSIVLSGSPAKLSLWNVNLRAAIGATAPLKTSTGAPPGHLASENDKAGLSVFGNAGVGANGPAGEICGNVSAQSLASVNVPTIIAKGGTFQCTEGYVQGTNSLLDVIVGGCHVAIFAAVNATQPDQQDSTVTFPAGTQPKYTLSASGGNHVNTCTDGSNPGKSVPIATCLAGLAYSSAFQFQTDRVIVK